MFENFFIERNARLGRQRFKALDDSEPIEKWARKFPQALQRLILTLLEEEGVSVTVQNGQTVCARKGSTEIKVWFYWDGICCACKGVPINWHAAFTAAEPWFHDQASPLTMGAGIHWKFLTKGNFLSLLKVILEILQEGRFVMNEEQLRRPVIELLQDPARVSRFESENHFPRGWLARNGHRIDVFSQKYQLRTEGWTYTLLENGFTIDGDLSEEEAACELLKAHCIDACERLGAPLELLDGDVLSTCKALDGLVVTCCFTSPFLPLIVTQDSVAGLREERESRLAEINIYCLHAGAMLKDALRFGPALAEKFVSYSAAWKKEQKELLAFLAEIPSASPASSEIA